MAHADLKPPPLRSTLVRWDDEKKHNVLIADHNSKLERVLRLLYNPNEKETETVLATWLTHFAQYDKERKLRPTVDEKVKGFSDVLGTGKDGDLVTSLFDTINSYMGPIRYYVRTEDTHKGTKTGPFKTWRVFATYRKHPQVDPYVQRLLNDMEKYCTGPYTVARASAVAETECDVNEFMGNRLFIACEDAVNQLLEAWYETTSWVKKEDCPQVRLRTRPYHIALDTEDCSLQMFADHAFVTVRGTNIIGYSITSEEKAPGTVNMAGMTKMTKANGALVNDVGGNLVEHLAQLLKYHHGYKSQFGILADGVEKNGFEWEVIPESATKSGHEEQRKLIYYKLEVEGRTAYQTVDYMLVTDLVAKGYFPKEPNPATKNTRRPA